jgi:uncharacterized repeat protein (TIGR01451 family)
LTNLDVKALTLDPTNATILYARTAGGVFKSNDGGSNWTDINAGLTSVDVRALDIDPTRPNILYVGTAAGVFRSTTGGSSWTAVNAGLSSLSNSSLTIDPSRPERVYIRTDDGNFVNIFSGLCLTLTTSATNPLPGSRITYTIALSNSRLSPVSNAIISDTLPAHLTLAGPVVLDPPQSGAVLATSPAHLPTLASNLTVTAQTQLTLTFPVTVSPGVAGGTQIANTVSLTSPDLSLVQKAAATFVISQPTHNTYFPLIMK